MVEVARGSAVNDQDWWRHNPYWRFGAPRPCSMSDLVAEAVSSDAARINVALCEARRRSLLVDLFEQLSNISDSPPSSRDAFHSAWTTQGLWLRETFYADRLLFDVLRNHLPGYHGPHLRLFRGE